MVVSATQEKTASTGAPAAGWYPTGKSGALAQWNGQAWTGETRQDDAVAEMGKWHHRPLAFLGHRWFWFMVIGNALIVAVAVATRSTDLPLVKWVLVIAAMAVFMSGVVYLLDRHQRFGQLTGLHTLVVWGIVSGAVASALAVLLENRLEPWLKVPVQGDLWLAGPIEETAKLAVPVLLLAFGGKVFKDPRAGLFLVMMSGIVFGAFEAALYTTQGKEWTPLEMAIGRPVTELLHPFLTATAAAVIWLAASRSGRTITVAGLVAWVGAMAVHSVHDGLSSFAVHGDHLTLPTATSARDAVAAGLGALVVGLVWTVIVYLMLRHTSRELVPPDAVPDNAPHWRPAIKGWGLRKEGESDAAAGQAPTEPAAPPPA